MVFYHLCGVYRDGMLDVCDFESVGWYEVAAEEVFESESRVRKERE